MKLPKLLQLSTWAHKLLFPALLVLVAGYYLHSMGDYISPLFTPDEFGYVSVAAFLAGHNWEAVAHGVPWYSYGYSLLLAPVFALTSPERWYRDAQWVNVALIVLVGVFANLFLRKICRNVRPWLRHVVVAIILLYPSLVFYSRFAWSETLVAVLPWLLGWLVYRVFEAPRRYVDAFLCGCLLMFAYYVHARLIVLLIAGLLVLVFVAYKTARWRELGLVVVGMLCVLAPAWWFKDYLMLHLYGGGMHGSQGSILKMLVSTLGRLGHGDAWRDLIGSGAGQLAYLVISTLGLLAVGLVVSVRQTWQSCKENRWAEGAALAFVLLGAAGCYALILITMGASPAMAQHVFYGRYTEPLILPIVAVGLLYLCREPRTAFVWILIAYIIACVLVPLGINVVSHLHTQTPYWTLITGLFTYKTGGWQLATDALLVGFLWVVVAMTIAFRTHRYVGLALTGGLFLLAGIGLAQTYASATSSHVQQWQVWGSPAFQKAHPDVLLDMQGGDPLNLRARIQVINAGLKIVPADRWRVGMASVYERITWNGKRVEHALCSDAPGSKDTPPACSPMINPDLVKASLAFNARSITLHKAHMATSVYRHLAGLPYLRSIWGSLYSSHTRLHYTIIAPVASGILIKTFVTAQGADTWLVDRQTFFRVPAGTTSGTVSVPVPVRYYTDGKLRKGDYTLHAVAVGLGGSEWSAKASIPLHID